MSLTIGMRVRVLALVAILGAAALAVGSFTLGRVDQTVAFDDTTVTPPRTAVQLSPRELAFARKEDPLTLVGDITTPAATPTSPQNPSSGSLPAPVAQALELHDVVVVPFVSPDGAVDDLVLREARAGARIASAGFVAVGVLDQAGVKQLTKAFGLRHTPSVLVFTSPDRLFVQLTGFVDKETVAQAATNARP